MRILPWLALVLAGVTACGGGAGSGTECTGIGASAGIGVDVAPLPAGTTVRAAKVEACWAGSCREVPVELRAATQAVDQGCSGDGPDAACSATMRETGGATGFATLPGLPAEPIRVTVEVGTVDGAVFARRELRVTPAAVYPNGPGCAAAGPQAQLTVDAEGRVHRS